MLKLFSLLFGVAGISSSLNAAETKPNVVFILSDDHRADLMSCAGHKFMKTPTLDSIAENGVRFENAFVTSPLCTPSRAGFLTGMYPERTGAPRINEKACSFLEFSRMFPEYLQEAGYQTAYVGKFHIGEGAKPKKGFDYWASWDWVGDPEDLTIYINGKPHPTKDFADDRISELAAEFIQTETKEDQPFFLYVGLKSPHLPYHYPERLEHAFDGVDIPPPASYHEDWEATDKRGLIGSQINFHTFPVGLKHWKTWENYIKSYYRSTLSIDESVKTVLDALEAKGLLDNTLLIYTSDHGYSNGEHALTEKHYAYENIMRVPMLVQYPSEIRGGRVNDELVINLDLAPTVLDFCGVATPEEMDGKSWKPLLTGAADGPLRDDFFFSLTCRDQRFFKPHSAVRSTRFKLIHFNTLDHWELYDLQKDPGEMVNLYGKAGYADEQAHLKKRLTALQKDASWSPLANDPVLALYALDAFPLEWDGAVREQLFAQQPVDYSLSLSVNGRELKWNEVRKKSIGDPLDLSAVFTESADTTYLSVPYESSKGEPGHMQFTVSETCNLALSGWFDNRLMYENWKSADLQGRPRKYMDTFFPYTPAVVPEGRGEIVVRAVSRPDSNPADLQCSILYEKKFHDLLLQ
jgi:arylsulfatase A-like enzyme